LKYLKKPAYYWLFYSAILITIMPILKLSLEDIQNSLSFNDERIASEFRGLSNTYLLKIIEGVRQEGVLCSKSSNV